MSIFWKCLAVLLLIVPDFTNAEIDSGGGVSTGGEFHSHSSIGSSFSTHITQAGSVQNHPGLIEIIYPLTPSSETDLDKNGLPDGWEIQYFGLPGIDPIADADLDGTSNLLEYLAGTNPNSELSVFRLHGSYFGGLFQILIPTVSGRNYQIWVSRDLQSWTLQNTLTGDGTARRFEFDETTITSGPLHSGSHPSNYFFRVQILIPPNP